MERNWREVDLSDLSRNLIYGTNSIRTTRLSWFTFVPLNLLNQLKRIPVLWFIALGILQAIYSDLYAAEDAATLGAIGCMIVFTMAIAATQDIIRFTNDRHINSKPVEIWNGRGFSSIKCQNLKVGNIVRLKTGDTAPADMLILAGSSNGSCLADLKLLTGRKNYSEKTAVRESQLLLEGWQTKTDLISKLEGDLLIPQPNSDIALFGGKMRLRGYPRAAHLEIANFLPRDSVILKTDSLLCLTVYVGVETKMMLSNIIVKRKCTRLENRLNKVSLVLVIVTLLICLICSAAGEAMNWDDDLNFGDHFVAFMLLYQHVIPVTLFFLLDATRLLQLVLIQREGKFKLTTCDINDEIGQIEYLVTDKTGTLTSAVLKMRMCKVGATEFLPNPEFSLESEESGDILSKNYHRPSNVSLLNTSSQPFTSLIANSEKEINRMFLQALALCNNVSLSPKGEILASSPDDVALVEGAENLGYKLIERQNRYAKLYINGVMTEYWIHAVLPFESEKRQMSVVIQEHHSNKAILMSKGTLDSIKDQCNFDFHEEEASMDGHQFNPMKCLRSVYFCYRVLSEAETKGLVDIVEYSKGVANEEGRIYDAVNEYKNCMNFIGAAYLEETVLPKVGETVLKLKNAGIKIWIATGDTEHSAYAAAVNARIVSIDVENLSLTNFTSQFDLKRMLTKGIKRCIYGEYEGLPLVRLNSPVEPVSARANFRGMERGKSLGDLKHIGGPKLYKAVAVNPDRDQTAFLEEPYDSSVLRYTLTVDGSTFELALSDPETRKIFSCLAFAAESVLACNMLPSQKADLVKLIQKNMSFKPRVMAVGDGNNDIAMIRQANVGVGISSQFSSQAANSSDIMARSFTDVAELVLHHGLKCHVGLAKGLLMAIYGNLAMTLLLFYYNFTADNSASAVMDPLYTQSFALFFFILPIFGIGTSDDISSEPLNVAYRKSIKFEYFSKVKVARFIGLSILHSGIIFLYVYPIFWGVIHPDGYTETEDLMGVTFMITLVLTVLLQAAIEMNRLSTPYVVTLLISLGTIFVFAYAIGEQTGTNLRLDGSFRQFEKCPPAVAAILCCPAFCFSISLIVKILKQGHSQIFPEDPYSRLMEFSGGLDQMYRDYKKWKADIEKEVYNIDKYRVKFKSLYTEMKFMNFYYVYQIKAIRFSVGLLAIVAAVYTIVAGSSGDENVGSNFLRAGFATVLIATLSITYFKFFKKWYVKFTLSLLTICIVGKFILELVSNTDGTLAASFAPPYIYTLFCVDFMTITQISIMNIFLTQISEAVFLSKSDNSTGEFILVIFRLLILTIGITVISAAVSYAAERNNRERYKLIEISEQEIQKTKAILSFLLPSFVKERVKDGARYIAEDQGTVTVIFCDIYDFDRICAEYAPSELTEFLDEFFRKLDQLCNVHGVTKIETVGKTYMACSGLKDSEADMPSHLLLRSHARRGVDMALDIIRTTKLFKLKYGEPLKVKIGINSGPVTAGVVGYHKPQFALVGDTVNTASRMCSTMPEANSIQITMNCYEMLSRYEGLDFADNQVEAKGKGIMQTKFVKENMSAGSIIYEPAHTLKLEPIVHSGKSAGAQKAYEDEKIISRRETELIGKICSCQCKESAKQREFRMNILEHAYPVMQIGLVTSLLVNTFLLLLAILEFSLLDNYAGPAQLACRIVMTIILSTLLVILRRVYTSTSYLIVIGLLTLFQSITAMMSLIENSEIRVSLAASEVIFVLLCLSHCSGLYFIRVFPLSVVILSIWIGISEDDTSNATYVVAILYIAFVILVNSFSVFYRESNIRTFANLKLTVDKENEKTESLLSHMMPAHVYENLKEDRAITDRLPSVALLFADICGFTAWSSNKTPIEVVGMLSELFTNFDMLCVKFDVFKVCTIGDCYVVMGYTGLEYRDPAAECARVTEFAFEMIQVIKDLNTKHKSELNMRIGVHIGEVIAGITGTNIVRYDIYGPDVLIANKMESGGQPGRINVSDSVKALIEAKWPSKYSYEFNTDISAKSVNRTHKSYFVMDKPPDSQHRLS
mmetsp:Transcript_17725/g.31998  ORF Transcript_17725/g.31998 Transcript_17725/m.31998 type:complete len:2024 (-) Transcript_17725:332-6403(-)